jgi:hypothetical protein
MVEIKTTLATKITTGGATLLAIIAIVMSSGLIGEDNVFVCLDTEIAMKCDKLSSVNSDGIQTRCYFFDEIENKTRYKNCKTGWLPYIPEKEKDINFTKLDRVYLLCEKNNQLVSMCQIIDSNETIYQVGG